MKAQCTSCRTVHDLGDRVWGKLGMSAALALLGGSGSKHPAGALVGAIAGMMVGHVVDKQILPKCPACGEALTILAPII